MFRWLVLAAALTLSLAEEAAPAAEAVVPDSQAEESANHNDHDVRYHDYGEDLPGTGVLREIHPSGHQLPRHRIEEQNKIVYDRYSPTYYQPTWILDYRYLKTGGRDYVRGEGGQILILPKGMKAPPDENKLFGDFDQLLEHLRLQELKEREELHRRRAGHENNHHEHHEGRRHKNERRQRVGWQQEAEREGHLDDRMEDMIKELVGRDDDNRRERWQPNHGHQEAYEWEKQAFGK